MKRLDAIRANPRVEDVPWLLERLEEMAGALLFMRKHVNDKCPGHRLDKCIPCRQIANILAKLDEEEGAGCQK